MANKEGEIFEQSLRIYISHTNKGKIAFEQQWDFFCKKDFDFIDV